MAMKRGAPKKGGTTVNIIVGGGHGAQPPMGLAAAGPMGPPPPGLMAARPPMGAPPAMPPAMPVRPAGPPVGMPAGAPAGLPGGMKRGGGVKMTAGAGTGLGRLQKSRKKR